MEIKKEQAPARQGNGGNGPVAKNDRFAVFQFTDKDNGEPVYSVEEKLAGGDKRYIKMRGQLYGTLIPAGDVLAMMAGEPVKLKGMRQADNRPFSVELCVRRVRTSEVDGKTYHNADLGAASFRINGENEVFGYSIKTKMDGKDVRIRFLREARLDDENVASLNSADIWKLWDAGVGSSVDLGGGIEGTLTSLEDKSEPGDAIKTFYASVRARQVAIAAEEAAGVESSDEVAGLDEEETASVKVG